MNWIRRNFDTCYIVGQVWLDGLSVLLAAWLGFFLFDLIAPNIAYIGIYRQLMVVIVAMCLASFWGFGLYRWQKSILNVEEYRALFKATLVAFVATATAIFLLKAAPPESVPLEHAIYRLLEPIHHALQLDSIENYSRPLFLLIFGCIFLIMVVQRSLMFKLLNYLHAKGLGNTKVAIFGTGDMALQLEKKLRLFPTLGYHFIGFLDNDADMHGRTKRGYPVFGGLDDLDEITTTHDIRRVFVAMPQLEESELLSICDSLTDLEIEHQVLPRLYNFFKKSYTVENLDSLPLLTSPERRRTRLVYTFAKRLMDLAITSPGILLIMPLLFLTAALVRLTSKGPALFQQYRIGKGGHAFRMYKFRSMYVDMCGDAPMPTSSHDPRITPFGKFMRHTSLDDLPQLWNVIKGDMSLVGPRPEQSFIVKEYSDIDKRRLTVKPGATGLWQVSNARARPIKEYFDYDIYYVENQSIFLDITIFILTIFTLLKIRQPTL